MSLQRIIGALVMGIIISTAGYSAENPGLELVEVMHHEGVRKNLLPEQRLDLQSILDYSKAYARKLDLGCQVGVLSEVRLTRDKFEMIAGYEVNLDCDDAPSTALGVYFDVNSRFIGSFDSGQ